MRYLIFITVFLFFFFLSIQTVSSQNDPVVQKIIEIGKTDNQTMHYLDVLTNRIGGRPVGSANYETAVAWAKKEFEELGMDVILHQTAVLPIGFNRGPWFGKMISGESDITTLDFATPSYTVGTKGVERGHVLVEPKTQREFNRMKGKLKGAWVLVSGKSTGFPIDFSTSADASRDSIISINAKIETENDVIRNYNRQNRNKGIQKELIPMREEPALFYRDMVEAGVLGIIQSSPVPITALYDRKNIDSMSWNNLPKVPDIKLNEHQFEKIEQMAKERQYFQLEFDIRNHFRLDPIPYHTVIGIIKGSKYPDEYVIMGGHLDSYDVATGASDNASGVAPAMEAARLIVKAGGKPKRSIMVSLWSGEEFGLLGSTAWLKDNADKLENISAMFNRDGGPLVPTSVSVPDAMLNDFEKICNPIKDINPEFPFSINKMQPRAKPLVAGGTDSTPFLMKGVPVIQLNTEDINGGNFSYGEIWHTTRDTYDKCPPDYMNHTSIVNAIIVYGVANLDHLLSREGYFIP
ncbi:MAG: M20/M25/M40 family metallo-hydrolase [Dysgonamonadaceae bacterium]|nr:M20/M25/M40 family metallo-hydrolase [Dysgonamonadaceae bacterium]MDD4729373.1 M20/M25/M40 family metallo-hydrolase [Dysgonamonadaceae bacterium]